VTIEWFYADKFKYRKNSSYVLERRQTDRQTDRQRDFASRGNTRRSSAWLHNYISYISILFFYLTVLSKGQIITFRIEFMEKISE
jgi:hypothetical protein